MRCVYLYQFSKRRKWSVLLGCSPARADLVAALGETTGETALRSIRARMQASTTGRTILEERPRITASFFVLANSPVIPSV